jgi:hypothetical protein
VTYLYKNELRRLSYLHHLFRSTSRSIPEDSKLPLILENHEDDVQCRHHRCNPLLSNRHCQANKIGREAFPGSSGRTQQVIPEATGEEDGGQQGRFGDLAMEAEKTCVSSLFQVALMLSPLSSSCRGCPHRGPTGPCRHQVCSLSRSS